MLQAAPVLEPAAEFAKPAPRLGRLLSTPESFADITINLSSRITTWGRGTNNSHVYPDGLETRIPKRGIAIYFHAKGIEDSEKAGKDWTRLPDLHCILHTESKVGVHVNGVKLQARDDHGHYLYGKVHTGDVITIASSNRTPSDVGQRGEGLKFVCEFFHGQAKETRVSRAKGFVIERQYRQAEADLAH